MVYKGKSHLEMDDLGVPLFQETTMFWDVHLFLVFSSHRSTATYCHNISFGLSNIVHVVVLIFKSSVKSNFS